ncbi:MAG: hypothetical protein OER80_02450 [Gammaproteobacteria bacterium]|nr:hypothetical protein [Gammaproteobacteria bacterium]MDH3768449.1 hypothetical protein [Gammaproteobacteria bacterium]
MNLFPRRLLAPLLVFSFLICACGFQLRGASLLPESMARVNLQAADMNSVMVDKLEAELARSGVELSSDAAAATTVLTILSDTADERVLSVSALGEPQEYELFHTVVFTMNTATGTVLEPVSVTLTRDYFFDEQDILGKSEDAVFLQDALAEDLARLIVRRAALALRAQGR